MGLEWLYINQEKFDEAEKDFKKYLEVVGEKGEIYIALGNLYKARGKKDIAKQMFDKSITINPELGGAEALKSLY